MRANQFIPEGRVKELAQDLKDKSMSDADFEKKYGKTRSDARAAMRKPTSESVAGLGKSIKRGVAEGSLNEFFYDPEGFGDGPEANYPCWDCGSTILGHHTKLCDLAEEWAIRDLPAEPGTQYWTREIPKGLKPIPGLKEGVAEGSEQRWRVTVGNKSGTLSHTKVFTGTREQAIKQAVRRFATTRDPVVHAELAEQGVTEGLSKRDQQDVAAIRAAIERLQAQLKQPNADRDAIQQSIEHERKRLALYKQGVAENMYSGTDDTVGFSVNSEAAYQAVMARFGDHVDHDETSGIMYVPERMWPQVEVVAFDADGEGAVQVDGLDEGEKIGGRHDADDFDDMVLRLKKLAGAGPMKTVYDPDRRVYRNMPTAQQPAQPPKKAPQ
jgi:uncharacterized small protein (DUF1192 family)